jgi:hypothetical protein
MQVLMNIIDIFQFRKTYKFYILPRKSCFGLRFLMNISCLQIWWLVFILVLPCSNSSLHIEELSGASKQQIQLAVKLSSEIFSRSRCIDFISSSAVAEVIASEFHKMSLTPIIIGHNYLDFPCKEYFVLVQNRHQILASVKYLPFRSRDNIVIFILSEICPGDEFLEARTFGAAKVAVICTDKKAVYSLDPIGRFHEITDNTKLFEGKSSSIKDYMGRSLSVSTFYCPPLSYGTGNGATSTSYSENGKHGNYK